MRITNQKQIFEMLKSKLRGKWGFWDYRETFLPSEYVPDPQVTKSLLDNSVDLFSVIVFSEHSTPRMFDNPKYYKKTYETVNSVLNQESGKKAFGNNAAYMESLEEEIKRNHPEFLDQDSRCGPIYGKFLDNLAAQVFAKTKKEIYSDVLLEYTSYWLMDHRPKLWQKIEKNDDQDEQDRKIQEFLEKNPKVKKSLHQQITSKEKTEIFSRRLDNQLPKNLARMISKLEVTKQLYFKRNNKDLQYGCGSTLGSGTREAHGAFGHLFANIQNGGKSIPTFIIYFDSRCKMTLFYNPGLVLYPHDLTGNYRMSHKDSDEMLSNIPKVEKDFSDLKKRFGREA